MSLLNRNGRRLKKVAKFIDDQAAALRERARTLTPADTGGNAALCAKVQGWLKLAAELLLLRKNYLKQPPWNFVNADSPEGAAEFLRTATAAPMEEQDSLTQFLYEKHRAALEEVAGGG